MRRLARILLNAATVVSLLLCLAIVTLWAASRTGRVLHVRYAPADARLWSLRSGSPRVPDYLTLATVAPWPHPPATGTAWGPARTTPPPAPALMLQPPVGFSATPPPAEWRAAGITLSHAQFIVVTVPTASNPTPSAAVISPTPLWSWTLTLPDAWPTTLFAMPPLAWLAGAYLARRRHRRNAGHCPACGYDLRATPEQCPECGMITMQ